MTGLVDWAAGRARMILAFIVLSLVVGGFCYVSLPKEGEPDIEIPAVFISVPFPGISAEDAEKLLVKPMETEMSDLDGLKLLQGTATEGYANLVMEFEFGWDKSATMADVRAAMNKAEANFPDGAENYTVDEFNFSEFPIVIITLSGPLPERTLLRIANDLQTDLESLEPVLEAALAGHRDEMVEVIIDPLRLEAYNVTALELINAVVNNNQLIAAGEVESRNGAFAVKIPSSFASTRDIYGLPIKVNGDSVVTLGDLTEINLTFEDRQGTARFNGDTTVALQVVKRKGFNLIDTVTLVKETVAKAQESWPPELSQAIVVSASNDTSREVRSMVQQLEGSVLTAICLVMIVVLAVMGPRPALLVGFAIPTSFLLCFALLAVMGISVSNIVMFGLILAVGMLVDGAIVVVEYADKKIDEGSGPMTAYVEAAKRMFWPIVSSTATTLCAFLPMLFWPGVPGEFMGMLPVTLIFVLSASLVVALVYLPVVGGVSGRLVRAITAIPYLPRIGVFLAAVAAMFIGALATLNPSLLAAEGSEPSAATGWVLFAVGAILTALTMEALRRPRVTTRVRSGYRRTIFGYFIKFLTGNPVMPVVAIGAVGAFVMYTFATFGENNNGVEFFVETEPEQAIVYVRARGNLSLGDKDRLVAQVEKTILDTDGIRSAFAFAGAGGLNANTGGASGPVDAIGQVQIELIPWEERPTLSSPIKVLGVTVLDRQLVDPRYDGNVVMENLQTRLNEIPGIYTEVTELAQGPAQGKPVHLRLKGDNFQVLQDSVLVARARLEETTGLIDVEDTLPLPGIDWEIDVDVEKAGRYGADVATVGAMVQLVTRGILLDTMRVPTSDEEIEIRVRLPEKDRLLSTLDTLKVRTPDGLVPLSNFITRKPVPKLGRIDRVDQERYYDVKADIAPGLVKVSAEDDAVLGYVKAGVEQDETQTLVDAAATADAGRNIVGAHNADGLYYAFVTTPDAAKMAEAIVNDNAKFAPLTPSERIEVLTEWLEAETPLPAGISWEWTGDQEEQEESGRFLMSAFAGALGLMFIILLAQFNSFYNSVLVLLAVVLSTAGVLWGMMIMGQAFSIIMTGTGIVALAGIVVNNNIVLIDTYQEYSQYMPKGEAIVRTAEQRIRPVMLTTITTMAGLAPMMFGLSLDFFGGGYTIDSPTALWWKQLATAVVFGLGIATVLTLVFTPSMLALRVWATEGSYRSVRQLLAVLSKTTVVGRDVRLNTRARRLGSPDLVWDVPQAPRRRPLAPLVAPGPLPEAANLGEMGIEVSRSAAATHDAQPIRAAE